MARPKSANSIIRNAKKDRVVETHTTDVASGMILPNQSGDHSGGIVRETPTKNIDIANKKYVDDEIDGDIATHAAIADAHQDLVTILDGTTINFSIAGQQITAETIDGAIDHNALLNYVADEHIDWTGTNENFQTIGAANIAGNLSLGSFGNNPRNNFNLNMFGASAGADIIRVNSTINDRGAFISLIRAKGVVTNLTPVTVGAQLGKLIFAGFDSDEDVRTAAEISSFTTAVDGTKVEGDIRFRTWINNVRGDRLIVQNNGDIEIFTGDLLFTGSGTGLLYANISATDNTTETAIATAGTAVQVLIFDTNGPNNNLTPDHTNDHITVVKAGNYMLTCSVTLNSVVGAGSRVQLTGQKNNGASLLAGIHSDRNVGGGGVESGAMTMNGIVTLAANDTVEIWIENETNTQNYTVEDISLSLVQVGG